MDSFLESVMPWTTKTEFTMHLNECDLPALQFVELIPTENVKSLKERPTFGSVS